MDFDMNTLKREIEAWLDFKDVAYNVAFGPHVLIRFEKLVDAWVFQSKVIVDVNNHLPIKQLGEGMDFQKKS